MILEDKSLKEADLLANCAKFAINRIVQISTDNDSLKWSCDFVKRNRDRGFLFSAGIHPSSRAETGDLSDLHESIKEILDSDVKHLLFGIGECGLDFYRNRQPVEMQIRSFEFQIECSKKHHLPLIIHSREAFDETIEILKRHSPVSGVMHCFSGNSRDARRVLDLGLFISFAGNLTYPKADNLRESASYVPSDRFLLQKDAPILTPVPLRGKKNRSEYIINTYDFFARLRKQPIQDVTEKVYGNFMELIRKTP